jgi:hypothetical protein
MACSVGGSRRWWPAALAGGLGLLVAPRALANVGLPMLPVGVAGRGRGLPAGGGGGGGCRAAGDRRAVGCGLEAVLRANLVTTLIGVPVTWLLMLFVQFLAFVVGSGLDIGGRWSWIAAPFVVAWLPPGVERATWWIGMAGAGLSVPLFFVSVWIERRVGRRVLGEAAPEAIRRWSWWANGWSYAGLVLFWVGVGVKWYLERPAG